MNFPEKQNQCAKLRSAGFLCFCLLSLATLPVIGLYYGSSIRAQYAPNVPSRPFAVFTVTNTFDNGAGSLRQAITDSNNAGGTDTINFDIPGSGVRTIALLSALPTITGTVVIDATTQPGFAGTPIIELNGTSAGSSNGFSISASNSTIKGFIINRFVANGVLITGNNNVVSGNYIGTNAAGAAALPNNVGVRISNATGNLVGGITPGTRNIISGNASIGIYLDGTSGNNNVQGNYIGTNASGTVAVKNATSGINIV